MNKERPEYSGGYKIGDLKEEWYPARLYTNGDLTLTVVWLNYKVTDVGVAGEGSDDKPYTHYEITKRVYKKQTLELDLKDIDKLEIKEYI